MMDRWSSDLFLNHRNDNPGLVDAIHITELSIDGAVVSLTGWDGTVIILCAFCRGLWCRGVGVITRMGVRMERVGTGQWSHCVPQPKWGDSPQSRWGGIMNR